MPNISISQTVISVVVNERKVLSPVVMCDKQE